MALSVLMSIYDKELPKHLDQCLGSLVTQTLQPDEVVVVKDGPLTSELEEVFARYSGRLPFVFVPLAKHVGLGNALAAGLQRCTSDIVARVDSDDIYPPFRMMQQVNFLRDNPNVSVVSAAGAEFEDDHRRPFGIRSSPGWVRLDRAARFRNPVSFHTTAMFRKDHVTAVGNYQSCTGFEDYYLWARMLLAGFRIYNMPDVLAYVRCGNGMLSKRRGPRYMGYEIAFLSKCYRIGFLSKSQLLFSFVSRIPFRLLPAGMLGSVYRAFLRKPVSTPSGNSLQ
jgi:glycosyltransferase involved in cell wall biosynthesis